MQTELARARAKGTPPQPIAKASDGMAEALFDLASALQSDRTGDLAQIYVQSAMWLRPHYPAANLLLGSLLENEQRYEAANAAYAAAGNDTTYGWAAKLHIASNLDQMGKSDEAVKVLEAMATEQPDRIDALVRLGDLWRSKVKQPGPFPEYDYALSAYDRAIARVPNPQPQHWTLFFSRAVVLERSGRWARAEPDLLKALELEPEQPSVLNYLGYSWADQRLHLDKALPMIERAVELRPRDGYIIDSLGWVHFRLGNVEKALGYMEQAVELRPQDPTINDHLGDVYWRVGRRAEARFQWERALRLEPEPEAIPQIQKKINEGLPPP
jgi:tetratricopeptide (TPR) repeat protein